MVSVGTQVSLLREHRGHSLGLLFSLSLVQAKDGWSRFSLSKAGQLIQQWWLPQSPNLPYFFGRGGGVVWGLRGLRRGGGGVTNERPGSDCVIWGPMRGFEKTAPGGADTQTDRQTHGHGNYMTNSARWGRVGENFMWHVTRDMPDHWHVGEVNRLLKFQLPLLWFGSEGVLKIERKRVTDLMNQSIDSCHRCL